MTIAFFCLSGLDFLRVKVDYENYINLIYSQQTKDGGFRGGPLCTMEDSNSQYDQAHITMTYTALLSLLILGDDLKRVLKTRTLESIKELQQKDGSFIPQINSSETDIRFLFCACAICFIFNDWSGIDVDLALNFIKSCQNYDGAFGTGPKRESHGNFMS